MRKYLSLLFACILSFLSYGQNDSITSSVISSGSGDTTVNDVSVSWTLGETAIETISDKDSTMILTQGFQQSYFIITSVSGPLSDNFKLKVFPNPASEFVWIDIKSDEIKQAVLELYNLEGDLVFRNKIKVQEGPTKVELSTFNASQYILRVLDSAGNVLETFKLIKR